MTEIHAAREARTAADEGRSDKLVSSFEVFMKHYRKGGAVAMIDLECFREWVATRKSPPLKAAESFRRALTAHIAHGGGGRRAFDPQVEAELLAVVRKKQRWPMAEKLGLNIGGNGYRAKGYHEQLREQPNGKAQAQTKAQAQAQAHPVAIPFSVAIPVGKVLDGEVEHQGCSKHEIAGPLVHFEDIARFSAEMECALPQHPLRQASKSCTDDDMSNDARSSPEPDALQEPGPPCKLARKRSRAAQGAPAHEWDAPWLQAWRREPGLLMGLLNGLGMRREELMRPDSSQAEFVGSMLRVFTPAQFDAFRKHTNFDPFSAPAMYMINSALERKFLEQTTSRDFLCPLDQDSVQFEPMGPGAPKRIGRFKSNTLTTDYLDSDSAFREIIGGNPVGRRTLDLQASRLHLALTTAWAGVAFRERAAQGKPWVFTHMRFRNLTTGSWHVLRVRWTIPDCAKPWIATADVQDVTRRFSHLVLQEQPSLF